MRGVFVMATNIWTSLLKSDVKTEIYCPGELDLNVTLDTFYNAFKAKLAENRVDADVTIGDVLWDDGEISQQRIIATYKGSDAANTNNIQQFLLGLDTMGNFTYVEEKVFLNRPTLPKYPKSRVSLPGRHSVSKPSNKQLIAGIIAGLFGILCAKVTFLLLVGLAVAAVCFGLYFFGKSKYDSAEGEYQGALSKAQKHNQEADAETRAWDEAWEKWDKNVLKTAYLASTNDIFGRFVRALSSSVKLTIKELYEDKKAELKDRKEKEYSEQQLNEQLEKKKTEFK